jgi:hypothetical protein
VIAAVGLVVVVIGAGLFDMSYQSVESFLGSKFAIVTDKQILPNQFINSTIPSEQLHEHNVILIHTTPQSGSVRLEGIDPNGMTFEKESTSGFLYHIIQRSNSGGSYYIQITDTGNQPVTVYAIMAEDPFLSKNCNVSYGVKCNLVQLSTSMVALGIVTFIVGVAIGMYYFRKERNLQKK